MRPPRSSPRANHVRDAALAAAVLLAAAGPAAAQLTPDRTYYGINRPAPMTVSVPAGADGPIRILLLRPVSGQEVAAAPAKAGGVDMGAMFPILWTTEDPTLLYAQLEVGGQRVGPPVVIEPMIARPPAVLVDTQNKPLASYGISGGPPADPRALDVRFVPLPQDSATGRPQISYSGVRAYVDRHVVLETSEGPIEFRLRPDQAPGTCWHFRELAAGGFYTDIIFHRVVPDAGGSPFVVQAGDPAGTGEGGPGFTIDLEDSRLPHDFGVISMARTWDPNSNGSQFFIGLSREGTQRLDGRYTAFGQAVGGADAIEKIEKTPLPPGGSRPVNPPRILSARLVDAPPFGSAPAPAKRPEPVIQR